MRPHRQGATIDWLQALRGIAAVLVVVTHAGWTLTQPANNQIAWNYLAHGALGVDLFFVISGFIMYLTTQDCDGTGRYATDFAIKRFARIWPLFFVVSMVYLGMEWMHAGSFPITFFAETLSQLVFRPISPKASEFFDLPIGVAWTLCFEAFFYVVITISLLSRKWRWWIVAALLAPGLVLYPLLEQELNFSFYHQSAITVSHYANLAINPMVWEFVLGLIAGWMYTSKRFTPPRPLAVLMLIAAFAAFVSIPQTHVSTLYGPTIKNGGLTVFAIFLLIALASKTLTLSIARPLVWLGTISYSIYLTHKLGFMAAAHVMTWMEFRDANTLDWVRFAVYLVCGVSTGALFFYAVEEPLSARVRKILLRMSAQRSDSGLSDSGAKPV